ncbi:MAG: transglycosylase family protein [Solirubrobacterales bacterium]|nr:transglycosylase family protein [Solirubrobacterales bacterium]
MLNTRTSIIALALIAALIIAGNLVRHRPQDGSGTSGAEIAIAAVTSQTPIGVAFQIGDIVDRSRAEAAEKVAEQQQAELERKLAQKKEADKFGDLPGSVTLATLNAIADCESGGDPEIVSSSGLYYGKYQFSPGTWESVGGKGLPSEASEAEQDYRAALLYTRSGPGQWPVCGQ